jgi:glycolate oxidase
MNQELPTSLLERLIALLGSEYVHLHNLEAFGRDETEDLLFLPAAAVQPGSAEEVAQVLTWCNEYKVALTTRGAGTGLSGGALPVKGGLVLDTRRLNRILEIDERNLQATVEPGVVTQQFQEAVQAKGLYYPPDPSSRGSCFIGGNLAESAGGPHAVKYGTTRDYVLNLQVALPNGNLIWTGANVLKNATGYNLTQLMVGSEGTLGVITKAVFRLIPHPKHNVLMLVPFSSLESACAAVSAVFREGIVPSALEFMEREAIEWAAAYLNEPMNLPPHEQAHLLVELDGNHPEQLMVEAERLFELMQEFECGEILLAEAEHQKAQLWRLRRNVAHAVKANSIYKEEDTVVPRAELPVLIRRIKQIGEAYGFKSVCYGHAGDGNVHVNIIRGELDETAWQQTIKGGIREIFEEVKRLGGTISGEHGIGLVQQEYLDVVFEPAHFELMRGIKKVFDPNGILNPGKIGL